MNGWQNLGEWLLSQLLLGRVWSILCFFVSSPMLIKGGEGWPFNCWPNQQLCQLAEASRVPEKLGHEKVTRRFAARNRKPRQSTSCRLLPADCQLDSQLWEGWLGSVAMWHQDQHILVCHHRCQAAPRWERISKVGNGLGLSYHPPCFLHFVGNCTEAAKTCALWLRKDSKHV